MNRTERLYQVDQLLSSRRVVTREALMDYLEFSWSTLKRDLAYLRDRMMANGFDAIRSSEPLRTPLDVLGKNFYSE
jgi:predicted DNA-binding transcriptional regulator YafY